MIRTNVDTEIIVATVRTIHHREWEEYHPQCHCRHSQIETVATGVQECPMEEVIRLKYLTGLPVPDTITLSGVETVSEGSDHNGRMKLGAMATTASNRWLPSARCGNNS